MRAAATLVAAIPALLILASSAEGARNRPILALAPDATNSTAPPARKPSLLASQSAGKVMKHEAMEWWQDVPKKALNASGTVKGGSLTTGSAFEHEEPPVPQPVTLHATPSNGRFTASKVVGEQTLCAAATNGKLEGCKHGCRCFGHQSCYPYAKAGGDVGVCSASIGSLIVLSILILSALALATSYVRLVLLSLDSSHGELIASLTSLQHQKSMMSSDTGSTICPATDSGRLEF